jgi:hypothetical protein
MKARSLLRLVIAFLAASLAGDPSWSAMAPYELPELDWQAAISTYVDLGGRNLEALRSIKALGPIVEREKASLAAAGVENLDLATINAVSSLFRSDISAAGTPVLLPFNFAIVDRDVIDTGAPSGAAAPPAYFRRLSPLGFYPGPYGYRAYFRLEGTSSVMVSGSSIFYRLPGDPALPSLRTCRSLIEEARQSDKITTGDFFKNLRNYGTRIGVVAAEYFGEREAAIPCLFAGSLIEVHILCDPYGDPDCKVKDVARDIIASLNFVGGAPRPHERTAVDDPINSLAKKMQDLEAAIANAGEPSMPRYGEPGELQTNSGVQGKQGSHDLGVYGNIVFPSDMSAVAQSVVYREDQICLKGDRNGGTVCDTRAGLRIRKIPIGEWRDNFCEARSGNNLPTCPAGHGHAGQDIWGKGWNSDAAEHPLRAAVDGVAFRRFPTQPAVTVSDVPGTNIDYVYRHMRPSMLDSNGIVASTPRAVRRGCVMALVDRLQGVSLAPTKLTDKGISYVATARHLHFEIRVPTKAGFQNVSPYQTVVWAHRAAITKVDDILASTKSCL